MEFALNANQRAIEGREGRMAKAKLLDLLDYIEQVERLNRKPALIVPVGHYCAFEEELLSLPGLSLNPGSGAEEVWLRLECLESSDPPPPPALLAPWLPAGRNPEEPPELGRPAPGEASATPMPPDAALLQEALDQYRSGPWRAWAAAERIRRRTMAQYDRLFALQQSMESEGAEMPLELVWGVGMALWNHPGGHRIVFPLLTQAVDISMNRQSLALEIRPRTRLPVLELEPYRALGCTGAARVEDLWRTHQEKQPGAISPFDTSGLAGFLSEAARALDPQGRFVPQPAAARGLPAFEPQLRVTDTWVLFARNRSPNALIEDIERLRQRLAAATEIPPGPAALVLPPAAERAQGPRISFRGRVHGPESEPGETMRELYFPKPYNAEQVSIVEKLENAPGVVVQGPPGTGKTHTIANLICHTMASGGRILVTSKGEPALAVLREHIPESLRALSVALLTEEKDGIEQFQRAIHTIAVTVSRIDPAQLEHSLLGTRQQIDGLHARIGQLEARIATLAQPHLGRVSFRGTPMLPVELAGHVRTQESRHGWFPDLLREAAAGAQFADPAIDPASIERLRAARRRLGADLTALGADLPEASTLPDAALIVRIHEDLRREHTLARSGDRGELALAAEAQAGPLQALLGHLGDALAIHRRAEQSQWAYSRPLLGAARRDAAGLWAPLEPLCQAVDALVELHRPFLDHPVALGPGAELDPEFLQAVKRGESGRSPLGLMPFGKASLRAVIQAARVAGLAPETAQDWARVAAYVEFSRRLRALASQWTARFEALGLGRLALPEDADALRLLREHAAHLRSLRDLQERLEPQIRWAARALFGEPLERLPLETPEALERLQSSVQRALERVPLRESAERLNVLLGRLAQRPGAPAAALRAFLSAALGQPERTAAQVLQGWTALLAELARLRGLQPDLALVREVSSSIERAGAPAWAQALRTQPAEAAEDRWLPPDWLEAWHWRLASSYLESIEPDARLRSLLAERAEAEQDLERSYRALIEQAAWLQIHRNCPPAVSAALQTYLNAVQQIGKGAGLRAARYRREARAAMLSAHRAVPCWIMPHWRVSETLPAEIGQFDLVIIDEASQSDLWALPCLLRGRRLLIVGDDHQVSPQGAGLSEQRIAELHERFLSAQVYGEQMTPEKSIYDLARVAFAGQTVMLQEHFRCARPIIEFSKREFYRHDLQPLRVPKMTERLDPPLVDIYVSGAQQHGNINEAEARVLVGEIARLLADPHCAGRSIGVVSLLGPEQARRIFDLVRENIPAREIIARSITVGDARTFQGKERDIMLLSMVVAPGSQEIAIGAMSEQRFNVAATRARDRMVLVRSLAPEDLEDPDLRLRLIRHFASPFGAAIDARPAEQRARLTSPFERALYDDLSSRGYRVLAKVSAGNDQIDLVVEGGRDQRLAIECDGDGYAGRELWAAAMARQRVLERAGWQVWRAFGASFVLHPKQVLENLLATLARLGIEPAGAPDASVAPLTEHRRVEADTVLRPGRAAAPSSVPSKH